VEGQHLVDRLERLSAIYRSLGHRPASETDLREVWDLLEEAKRTAPDDPGVQGITMAWSPAAAVSSPIPPLSYTELKALTQMTAWRLKGLIPPPDS
jgi:hypothetical protein